jgi:hypothetical protein
MQPEGYANSMFLAPDRVLVNFAHSGIWGGRQGTPSVSSRSNPRYTMGAMASYAAEWSGRGTAEH